MAGTYKTAGRQHLLSFLMNHPDRQFTVDELMESLSGGDRPPVGKSSLYRHLSNLCDEGVVRKYRGDNQSAYVYQYLGHGDCGHHFHLKCLSCGELFHLECAVSDELLSHISTDHHFRVDSGRSILYGHCEACAAMEKRQTPADPFPPPCSRSH